MEMATREEVSQLVRLLLGSYPAGKPHDPEIYATTIAAAFAEYPVLVGREAVRTVQRRCKFLPTLAELYEALEEEMRPVRERERAERQRRERARQIGQRTGPPQRTPDQLRKVHEIVTRIFEHNRHIERDLCGSGSRETDGKGGF